MDEILRLVPHSSQPSLFSHQVGICITRFEACIVFTCVTACSLADLPEEIFCTRGFDRLVTEVLPLRLLPAEAVIAGRD